MSTGTKKAATPKPPVPTEKQRAVLDALKGGRSVQVTEANGKKKLTVLGPTGKPVKEQPKLDRSALEACEKKGWVTAGTGQLTDEGKKAKNRKVAA